MRLVRVAQGWRAVEDLHEEADQLQLWQRQPGLLAHLHQATPLVQWLTAAREPAALAGQSVTPALAHTLQVAGLPVAYKLAGPAQRGF